MRGEAPLVYNRRQMGKSKQVLLFQSTMTDDRYRGIAEFARAHDWTVFIESDAARPPTGWRGDGVLAALEDSRPVAKFLDELRRRRVPVVDLADHCVRSVKARVTVDNAAVGRLAAEHFLSRGYVHAAWFSHGWSRVHQQRLACFSTGFSACVERWVWAESAPRGRRNDMHAFSNWLVPLLRAAPKPLAVFCYNDLDALRVTNTCLDSGLSVPEEVAVLGVDDNPLICESAAVPLSSVKHAFRQIGRDGAQMLQELMDGHSAMPRTLRLPPGGVTERLSTNASGVEDPTLRRAIDWIGENLVRPFGADDVADAVGLSRGGLYTLFRQKLRRTVNDEILRQRLALAKRLLRDSNRNLDDIAAACGFCNASYFIAVFRRQSGVTPRDYQIR